MNTRAGEHEWTTNSPTPMPSDLNLTLGALEVGTWLSTVLYGIIILQVYMYIQADFKDDMVIKVLVFTMCVLDTAETVLSCIFIYNLSVVQYGQLGEIDLINWTFGVIIGLNGIISVLVQSFFAYRIQIISSRWGLSVLSWFISAARLGFIITITVFGLESQTFSGFLRDYEWTVPAAFSTMAFGDLLNASALCYFLKRRSSFADHDRVIIRIMTWSIENGLITSICALTDLILSLAIPESLIWIGLYMFFPKFYTISLMSSLNNRPHLRRLDASHIGTVGSAAVRRLADMPHIEMAQRKSGDDWSERTAVQRHTS